MVTFYEQGHKYLNTQGEQYISVTTLLHRYKPPFDGEYWSLYKALKLVFERKGSWAVFKSKAGGWDKVVDYYKTITNHPYHSQVLIEKQKFLDDWEKSGKVARDNGTAYHKKMEDNAISAGVDVFEGVPVPTHANTDLITFQEFKRDGAHHEVVLYNDQYKLAGQADKVIKFGRKVNIRDYKTSAKIDTAGFNDIMMKQPVEHMLNCNYNEYTLQLSIYAWMLEQRGYEVGNLAIEHVPDNHKLYPVDYKKKEVEALLQHYARSKNNHIPATGKETDSRLTY